jgi:hypothetical protein
MRPVPGQPGEIANSQDGSTLDCGHRHPVQHAILSENQASPPACRLLLWQPEELLQVREIEQRANCGRLCTINLARQRTLWRHGSVHPGIIRFHC